MVGGRQNACGGREWSLGATWIFLVQVLSLRTKTGLGPLRQLFLGQLDLARQWRISQLGWRAWPSQVTWAASIMTFNVTSRLPFAVRLSPLCQPSSTLPSEPRTTREISKYNRSDRPAKPSCRHTFDALPSSVRAVFQNTFRIRTLKNQWKVVSWNWLVPLRVICLYRLSTFSAILLWQSVTR